MGQIYEQYQSKLKSHCTSNYLSSVRNQCMLSRSYFGSDVCGQLYEQYQSKNWRVTAQVAIYPVCWSCLGNDVCGQIHEQYQSQNGRVTAQVTIYAITFSCYHIHVSAVMIVGKFMSNINHVSKSHCTSSYLSSAATVSCLSLSLSESRCQMFISAQGLTNRQGSDLCGDLWAVSITSWRATLRNLMPTLHAQTCQMILYHKISVIQRFLQNRRKDEPEIWKAKAAWL